MTARAKRIRPWTALAILTLLVLLATAVRASKGDKQRTFTSCLEECTGTEACRAEVKASHNAALLLSQILPFSWDCTSECKYKCMWQVEAARRGSPALGGRGKVLHEAADDRAAEPIQYYGKWPFRRLFGCQEPASVFFSIANGAAHVMGYRYIYREGLLGRHAQWFLHGTVRFAAILAVLAWTFSTVFHCRDCALTEHLDYSGAIALIAFNLYIAIVRVASLKSATRRSTVLLGIALISCLHLFYLVAIDFDYTWNAIFAALLAGTWALLFGSWAVYEMAVRVKGRRPHAIVALGAVCLTILGTMLELHDFAPIADIFDSHSLWHAATVPITFAWYAFFRADAMFDLRIKNNARYKIADYI